MEGGHEDQRDSKDNLRSRLPIESDIGLRQIMGRLDLLAQDQNLLIYLLLIQSDEDGGGEGLNAIFEFFFEVCLEEALFSS